MSYNFQLPDSPLVELELGNYRISPTPPNQKIVSFKYTRSGNDKSNNAEISLVDTDVVKIEEKLIENRDEIRFRYGWNINDVSNYYKGMLVDYKTELYSESRSVNIDIEIAPTATESFTRDRKKVYKKENGSPMKIHEIVEDIAEFEGWQVGKIVETLPVVDYEQSREMKSEEVTEKDLSEDSNYGEKVFSQDNISSIKFIKNELIPNAISVNGRGGYRIWFNDKVKNPEINFAPTSYKGPPSDKFVFKVGAKNSRVLKFSHQNDGATQMAGGNAEIRGSFPDSVTNDLVERKVSLEDLEIEYAEGRMINSDKRSVRYMNESSSNPLEAIHRYKSYKMKAQSYSYKADMEIRGNPSYDILDKIDVLIYTNRGELHHTSGRYVIHEITDDISEGDYVTTLELQRDTSKQEEEKVD